MKEDDAGLRINRSLVIPWSELSFSYARSGGPGGQNVNKVNTKAILRFGLLGSPSLSEHQRERLRLRLPPRYLTKEGEVVIASDEARDQESNRLACLSRFREACAAALQRPKRRIPTRPSRGSKERRLESKKRHSAKKQDRRWKSSG